jgi:hypothetical protein
MPEVVVEVASLGRRFKRQSAGTTWASGAAAVDVTARELADQHLLLVPTTVSVDTVSSLVRDRIPDSDLAGSGEVSLGRHSLFTGPYDFALEDAVEAAVPMPWTLGYALSVPVEREGPPIGGMDDRDGFAFAFPEGLPWREEGRALHLLVSLARRLGGAVRAAGSQELIIPDPERAVDFVVYSPMGLSPEVLLGVVAREIASAHLAVEGVDWPGPPEGVYSGAVLAEDTSHDPLTHEELEILHGVADRKDDESLAVEALDAYAVMAPLPMPRSDQSAPATGLGDGAVEVLVHACDGSEAAVAGEPWAQAPFAVYEVRWDCPDPAERERRRPSAGLMGSRTRVKPRVERVARAVVEATSGVVVDEDGFRVDRYSL